MKGERTNLKFAQKMLVTLIMLVILFPYFVFNISEAKKKAEVPDGLYELVGGDIALAIEDRYGEFIRSASWESIDDTGRNYSRGTVTIDQGTDLWIYFANDENTYEVEIRGSWMDYTKGGGDPTGIKIENVPGQPICILAQYINDFDYLQSLYEKYAGYGTVTPHYTLNIRRKGSSVDAAIVSIGVKPVRNSLYIAGNAENAAIKDGTLYIKPGATVKITNAFREMDYQAKGYLENGTRGTGTYRESGAAIRTISSGYGIATVTASNRLGDTGYLQWENTAGANCWMPIVVSDLAGTYFERSIWKRKCKSSSKSNNRSMAIFGKYIY